MSILEIKNKVNQLTSSWEEFKSIQEVANKNSGSKGVDPLTIEQLNRINISLDAQQDNLNRLEATLLRPGAENKACNSQYEDSHKKAFNNYLITGNEQDLRALEKRSLSTVSDSDGGYFITQNAIDVVVAAIEEYSPMRKLATVTTISGDALEVIEDFDDAYAGWTGEAEIREVTKTPTLNKKIINVHEMYAQPKATQKLIDDASIDAEEWLTKKLTDAFQRIENASFIHGDGVGKPRGL